MDDADILEIIDHHKLGMVETLKPVLFMNRPVGYVNHCIRDVCGEPNRDSKRYCRDHVCSNSFRHFNVPFAHLYTAG